MNEIKEELKNIIKKMTTTVRNKFKPIFAELEEINPKLYNDLGDISQMSIVLFFLEQAAEHWVDDFIEDDE